METRRSLLKLLGGAAAAALPLIGRAETYPGKPIRLIVPYPPGGGSDSFARVLSPKMFELLGQQLLVDNRPGAATIIGADAAAKSAPDGYTLLLGDNSTYAVNPSLYKKMPYAPLKDFAPISLTARFALGLTVNPAVPVNSVAEFVSYAKAQSAPVNYGSPGAGSPHHLAMEMFAQRAGIKMQHVAYKGGAPATQDLVAGIIPAMMLDYSTAAQYLPSARLRMLGLASSARLEQAASIPTIAESGYPGYEAWAWQGIVAPAGTPQPIIEQLNQALLKAAADPAIQKRMVDFGGEFKGSSPAAMRSYMEAETAKWAQIIKDANISIE